MSGKLQFYLVAIPAVILLGLSKGGFSGLSTLAMPMLSLVSRRSGRPRSCCRSSSCRTGSACGPSAATFRRVTSSILIPSSIIGVARGWVLAARVSDDAVRLAVGRDLDRFRRLHADPGPARPRSGRRKPGARGVLLGLARGLHQYHQPFRRAALQVYVMPQYLKPRVFRGHGDDVLRRRQLFKIPPYFLLGQFSRENLIGLRRPHAGRRCLHPRRRLAGAPGLARAILRAHYCADLSDRRQIDI